MKQVTVGVVGVGVVGIEILNILRERNFPSKNIRVFARSERDIEIDGRLYTVEAIDKASFAGIDIALFAGTEGEAGASTLYASKFIEEGAVVIDNGSDFRMKDGVPLIVPQVNRERIANHKGLIANPNCTTIQMVVALGGIQKKFGLEQIILTSFQATSGAGRSAVSALWDESKAIVNSNDKAGNYADINKILPKTSGVFSHQIAFNAIPQIGSFQEGNYTSEEWKVIKETHKIFADSSIKVSATCVRIPVFTAHSEAIYFTVKEKATFNQIADVLAASEGVIYSAKPEDYPLALEVEGKDEVFIGRLRRDPFQENGFWMWCVADNLRKGAALNAVEIAECLLKD
ncbi:MAG: aspartate-semialdehyde dehydrogenase [Candidatus Omnitrophica bacterium]|nr:aspartate-semialdehyde dehydrogenase [Candidatus Omnitrophota bacterium]